jgi:hypothetical protein
MFPLRAIGERCDEFQSLQSAFPIAFLNASHDPPACQGWMTGLEPATSRSTNMRSWWGTVTEVTDDPPTTKPRRFHQGLIC